MGRLGLNVVETRPRVDLLLFPTRKACRHFSKPADALPSCLLGPLTPAMPHDFLHMDLIPHHRSKRLACRKGRRKQM
jgi:hypothetical protein